MIRIFSDHVNVYERFGDSAMFYDKLYYDPSFMTIIPPSYDSICLYLLCSFRYNGVQLQKYMFLEKSIRLVFINFAQHIKTCYSMANNRILALLSNNFLINVHQNLSPIYVKEYSKIFTFGYFFGIITANTLSIYSANFVYRGKIELHNLVGVLFYNH